MTQNQHSAPDPDIDIALIETMRVDPGPAIPLLAGHRSRLQTSCQALGYPWPGEQLFAELGRHAAALDPGKSHRIRLLLDRSGRFTFTSGPLTPTPEPVQIRLAPQMLEAPVFWLAHKTTHRPWYELAQSWLAMHPEVFDLVFCNEREELSEGSRCNVYIQDDQGVWLTPHTDSGLLPGVMRQALIERGDVREARISRADFLQAPAWRVSNALRGWLDARLRLGAIKAPGNKEQQ
ncbi:aminotransferase [Allopusillimonas soli]|uniref:Aminotransferase class IV n=1 Tax=Allopusillimonas soli TaxID=659016 RepID=A0A853F583_9BURK|nr:aminotransferase class IV [Allopusillimonas soli]NYT35674.1 aminotransferase class IV [Allopusillimonas soli]TEA76067.1 aminotransferase [Allopusillimonas soli]